MSTQSTVTRRRFVAATAAGSAFAFAANAHEKKDNEKIPVGLELYSVRHELEKDWSGTLGRVADMGYECVEFYSPYFSWTTDHAREVRKRLDDVKLRCYSTHNSGAAFTGDGIDKAIELNKIIGSEYIVMASPGHEPTTLDQWKALAELIDKGNDRFKSAGLHAGYHNHGPEWKAIDGQLPLEAIASNTDKSVMMQLDVGTCVAAGSDPVAWIENHHGRIRSLHLKDWSAASGYDVLFGEGSAPWQNILKASESKGGVKFFLIEQEGSRFPELETAERCLVAYKDLRAKMTA